MVIFSRIVVESVGNMLIILIFIQCVSSPIPPINKKWYSGSRLNLFNDKHTQNNQESVVPSNSQKEPSDAKINNDLLRYENFVLENTDIITTNILIGDPKIIVCQEIAFVNFISVYVITKTNKINILGDILKHCLPDNICDFTSLKLPIDVKTIILKHECLIAHSFSCSMVRAKSPMDRKFCRHLCLGIMDNCLSSQLVLNKYFILSCIKRKLQIFYENNKCIVNMGIFQNPFKNGYDLEQTFKIHSTEFQIGTFSIDNINSDATIKFAYQIEKPIVFTSLPQESSNFGIIIIEGAKKDGFVAKYITNNNKTQPNIKLDDIVYLAFTKGDHSLTIYKRFIVSTLIVTNTEKTRIPVDETKNWTILTQVQHTNDGDKYFLSRLEKVKSEYYITLDSISNADTGLKMAIVGYIAIEMSSDEFDNSVGEVDAYGLFYATFKTDILSSDGDHEINISQTLNDLKSPSIIKVIKLNSIRNNLNVDSSNNIKFSPKYIFGNVEYAGNQQIANGAKSIHQKCCFLNSYSEHSWNLIIHNSDFTVDSAKNNTFVISGIYIEDYRQVILKRLCLSSKPIKNFSFIECYKKCKSSRELIYCPQTNNAIDCLRDYIKPVCYINDDSSLYIKIMNDIHKKGVLFFKKTEASTLSGNSFNSDLLKKVRNKLLPIVEESTDVMDSKGNILTPTDAKNDIIVAKTNKIVCVTGEWEEWGNCSNICYDSDLNAQLEEFGPLIQSEFFEYRTRRRTIYYKSQNAECPATEDSKCVGLKKCSDICFYRLNKIGEAIIFIWTKECEKLNLILPRNSTTDLNYANLSASQAAPIDKIYECKFDEIWSNCDAPCINNDNSNENKPMEYLLAPNCAESRSRSCTQELKPCTTAATGKLVDASQEDKKIKQTIYLDRAVFKPNENGWVGDKNSCHCQFDENEIVEVSNAEELYFSGPDRYLSFQTADGNFREPRGYFSNMFPEYDQLDEIYPNNIDKSHTYLNYMASLKNGQFIEFPSTFNKQAVYRMSPLDPMDPLDPMGLKNYCATGSEFIKPIDDHLLNVNCDEIRPKSKMYTSNGGQMVLNEEEYNNDYISCKVSCSELHKDCAVRIDIFKSSKIINECTKNLIENDKLDINNTKCNFSLETNPNNLLRAAIVHQSQDLCITSSMDTNQSYDPSFCQLICKKYYNTCLYQHKLDLESETRECLLKKLDVTKRGLMIKSMCEFRKPGENVVRGGGLVFCKSTPVDCKYSEWSNWSECESNLKSRSRGIISGGNNFGKPCLGNHENLNQKETCNKLLQDNTPKPLILASLPKDVFKAQQKWDLNSEIKRLVKLHYQYESNIESTGKCQIFLGQRGIDEFRLIIDRGKCSCPPEYTPCTLPQSVTDKEWMARLSELCEKNPLAFVLFKKSKFFDNMNTSKSDGTVEDGCDKCNIGWTNISSFHFTCLNMTFVRHDYEALKLLCTASGDTTFVSCTIDKELIELRRKRALISALIFLCAGMLLGICLVLFFVLSNRRKRLVLANCSDLNFTY